MNKPLARWIVNVVAFVVFTLQVLTGLAAWWLPHGGGAAGSLRHALHGFHMAAGLLMVAVVGVHLLLHWRYIVGNLKQYGVPNR